MYIKKISKFFIDILEICIYILFPYFTLFYLDTLFIFIYKKCVRFFYILQFVCLYIC